MKRFLLAAALILAPSFAFAQAQITTNCNSIPGFGATGTHYPFMDITGKLCVSGSGGGGGGASAQANAAPPTWTEGASPPLSVDLSGNQRVVDKNSQAILSALTGAIPAQTVPGIDIGATEPFASTLGGATPFHIIAGASNNATLISAGAHTIYEAQLSGVGSAPGYLKFYDKATAPTCGTDVPIKVLAIPAASTAANGGGSNVVTVVGVKVTAGLGICVVTGIADTDNVAVAAATFNINFDYK
jgi:hypothetical protein